MPALLIKAQYLLRLRYRIIFLLKLSTAYFNIWWKRGMKSVRNLFVPWHAKAFSVTDPDPGGSAFFSWPPDPQYWLKIVSSIFRSKASLWACLSYTHSLRSSFSHAGCNIFFPLTPTIQLWRHIFISYKIWQCVNTVLLSTFIFSVCTFVCLIISLINYQYFSVVRVEYLFFLPGSDTQGFGSVHLSHVWSQGKNLYLGLTA